MDKKPLVAKQSTSIFIDDYSYCIESVPNLPILLHPLLASQGNMEAKDAVKNTALFPVEPPLNQNDTKEINKGSKKDDMIAPQVTAEGTVDPSNVTTKMQDIDNGGSPKALSIAEHEIERPISKAAEQVDSVTKHSDANAISSKQDSIVTEPADVQTGQTRVIANQKNSPEQNSETSKSDELNKLSLSNISGLSLATPQATPTDPPVANNEQTQSDSAITVSSAAPLIESTRTPLDTHLEDAIVTKPNDEPTQNAAQMATESISTQGNLVAEETVAEEAIAEKSISEKTIAEKSIPEKNNAEKSIPEKTIAKEQLSSTNIVAPTLPVESITCSSSKSLAPLSLTAPVSTIQSDLTSLDSPIQLMLSTPSVFSSLSSQAEAVVATLTQSVLSNSARSTLGDGRDSVITTPSHVSVVKEAPQLPLLHQLPRELAMLAGMGAEKLKVKQAEIFQNSAELLNRQNIEIKSREEARGKAPPQVAVIPPIIDLSKSHEQSRFIVKQQQQQQERIFKKVRDVGTVDKHTPGLQTSHKGE